MDDFLGELLNEIEKVRIRRGRPPLPKHRDGIDPDKGEKVKGERWRNIYRMDSGFDYGYKLFSSEALARDGANRTCAVYDPRLPSENADGNIEMQGKIRYVLQLPWRE